MKISKKIFKNKFKKKSKKKQHNTLFRNTKTKKRKKKIRQTGRANQSINNQIFIKDIETNNNLLLKDVINCDPNNPNIYNICKNSFISSIKFTNLENLIKMVIGKLTPHDIENDEPPPLESIPSASSGGSRFNGNDRDYEIFHEKRQEVLDSGRLPYSGPDPTSGPKFNDVADLVGSVVGNIHPAINKEAQDIQKSPAFFPLVKCLKSELNTSGALVPKCNKITDNHFEAPTSCQVKQELIDNNKSEIIIQMADSILCKLLSDFYSQQITKSWKEFLEYKGSLGNSVNRDTLDLVQWLISKINNFSEIIKIKDTTTIDEEVKEKILDVSTRPDCNMAERILLAAWLHIYFKKNNYIILQKPNTRNELFFFQLGPEKSYSNDDDDENMDFVSEYINDKFRETVNLESYSLNVLSIFATPSRNLFSGSNITEIDISYCNNIIGRRLVLGQCRQLTSVTGLSGNLPENMFNNCELLKNIDVTLCNLEEAGFCFSGCDNLISITGLKGKNLPRQIFQSCNSLEQIDLNGCNLEKCIQGFAYCQNLNTVSNISGILTRRLFLNCRSLINIDISNCKLIGGGIFENCIKLQNIGVINSKLGNDVFSGCTSLQKIVFSSDCNLDDNAQGSFKYCSALTTVDGLENKFIPRDFFRNCTSLVQINLSGCILSSAFNAFTGCSSLETITGLQGVIPLGENYPFNECTNLNTINYNDQELTLEQFTEKIKSQPGLN